MFRASGGSSLENKAYFEASALKYKHTIAAVGWKDKASQKKRFEVILSMIKEPNVSILDVGCGKGDLYDEIKQTQKKASYKGIDISSKMIELARSAFPEGKFEVGDLYTYAYSEIPDYIVANGVFNLKTNDNNLKMLKEAIKIFKINSKKGFILTVLVGKEVFKSLFYYYQTDEIERVLKELGVTFIKKEGYLENCCCYLGVK